MNRLIRRLEKDFKKENVSTVDMRYLAESVELMGEWEYLLPVSMDFYKKYNHQAWKIAMAQTGIYQLITYELLDFVKSLIQDENSIEVCCGLGILGRSLHIPFIDRKVCEIPEAKMVMDVRKSETQGLNKDIKYPSDVETMTAHQALVKYNPKWVIGCYVTPKYGGNFRTGSMYGPMEEEFIKDRNYIHCGSGSNPVHIKKPINRVEHLVIEADWLVCRSSDVAPSQIRIWSKEEINIDEIPEELEFEYYKEKL